LIVLLITGTSNLILAGVTNDDLAYWAVSALIALLLAELNSSTSITGSCKVGTSSSGGISQLAISTVGT
jgi:hypothetical protein